MTWKRKTEGLVRRQSSKREWGPEPSSTNSNEGKSTMVHLKKKKPTKKTTVCMWICVLGFLCGQVSICACTHVWKSKNNFGSHPSGTTFLAFWDRVSCWQLSLGIRQNAWPASSRDLCVSAFPGLGLQAYATSPGFLQGFWWSNPSLKVRVASTLLNVLPHQPQVANSDCPLIALLTLST